MTVSDLVGKVSQRRACFRRNCRKLVTPKFRNKVFYLHSPIFAQRKDLVKCHLCTVPIPGEEPLWLNAGVDKKQCRKQWLRELQKREGSVAALAAKVQTDANYISSLLGPSSRRNVGDPLAKRVERAYSLPPGTIDLPSQGIQKIIKAAEGLDHENLEKVLEYVHFLKSTKN